MTEATVKTAISMQRPLFDHVERLARKMKISRSRVFALAVEEYIRRREAVELLDRINRAYDDEPTLEEKQLAPGRRRRHRRLVEGEW
jgi:metal-responsive CopG/Arc/MetJ family transcriptional regulator